MGWVLCSFPFYFILSRFTVSTLLLPFTLSSCRSFSNRIFSFVVSLHSSLYCVRTTWTCFFLFCSYSKSLFSLFLILSVAVTSTILLSILISVACTLLISLFHRPCFWFTYHYWHNVCLQLRFRSLFCISLFTWNQLYVCLKQTGYGCLVTLEGCKSLEMRQ